MLPVFRYDVVYRHVECSVSGIETSLFFVIPKRSVSEVEISLEILRRTAFAQDDGIRVIFYLAVKCYFGLLPKLYLPLGKCYLNLQFKLRFDFL